MGYTYSFHSSFIYPITISITYYLIYLLHFLKFCPHSNPLFICNLFLVPQNTSLSATQFGINECQVETLQIEFNPWIRLINQLTHKYALRGLSTGAIGVEHVYMSPLKLIIIIAGNVFPRKQLFQPRTRALIPLIRFNHDFLSQKHLLWYLLIPVEGHV